MPLILIVCPPEFDRNVTALDVTGFDESLTKFSRGGRPIKPNPEVSNHGDRRLLRTCRERPRRRAAEPNDEFAPSKPNAHVPLPCEETLIDGE